MSARESALALYRGILRLHRTRLPALHRELGDKYIKAEFRSHRSAKESFLPGFYQAWEQYAEGLRNQSPVNGFGAPLEGETIRTMSDEQRSMLAKLAQETQSLK